MRFRNGCRGWWIAAAVIVADRVTKALSFSLPERGARQLVPGVLQLRRVENYGAAFGLFSGRMIFLAALILVISALLIFFLFRFPDWSKTARAGLWLVLAGGLSNLYDRFAYGFVADFLEFSFIKFPVFNLADVAIVAGCGLMLLAVTVLDGRRSRDA